MSIAKRNKEPRTGCGIWISEDDNRNKSVRIKPTTKKAADLTAILLIAQSAPTFAPLHVVTTSSYVVKALTSEFTHWETNGWFGLENADLIRAVIAHLRKRSAITTLRWTSKNKLTNENKAAKQLAKNGMSSTPIETIDITIPESFNLTGAELAQITQASAYGAIREGRKTEQRRTTIENIQKIQIGIKTITGHTPKPSHIWESLRDKTIEHTIGDFLWKLTHNAHKVGNYWKNIPGYEDRRNCPKCDTPETMTHILFECEEQGQTAVWDLAQNLWSKSGQKWPTQSLETLIGCGLIPFKQIDKKTGTSEDDDQNTLHLARDPRKKKPKGKSGRQRLYMILMTESAYLIWKLRNERRIRHSPEENFSHSTTEITNRWYNMINNRLTLDRAMANPAKFAKKALDPDIVLKTWSGVLQNEQDLPNDWIREPEVLVGRGPPHIVAGQHRLRGVPRVPHCPP
ncbi:hypothetical protein QCA50_013407 [Cerrena zonata]|uniref:RNase H type-1 domain-containing protein n=1 Tax=Cerrena zonata TaxID=2478898 RepID=A0AAW0FWU9_9APHY